VTREKRAKPANESGSLPKIGNRKSSLGNSSVTLSRQKKMVAWLSVASNSALVAGKLAVGLLIGSVSVLSEAIHSGIDLLAAAIPTVTARSRTSPARSRPC
jgi:queuine/archaeosine tRNA-ribosyltransferase